MRRFTVLATIVALFWNITALVSGPSVVAAQDATPPAGGDARSSAPAVGDAVPFLGSDGEEIGRVTVTAVADPWEEYEADNAPERGSHYVLVTVTIENTGPRPLSVEAGHFFLLDAEGFVFRLPAMGVYRGGEAEDAEPDVASIQELAPGEQLSGVVEFLVPDGAANLARVVFTPTPGLQGPDRLVYAAELPREGAVPPTVGDAASVLGPDGAEMAQVTVTEAIDPFQDYDPDAAPDSGSRYVVLNVTVKNTGPRPLSLSVGDFLIRDTDGFIYRPDFFSRGPSEEETPDLGVLDLPPGEQVSGFIEFMLPDVSDPRELLWWPETDRLILVADLGLAGPAATAVPETAAPAQPGSILVTAAVGEGTGAGEHLLASGTAVELILDTSGSMLQPLGEELRIDVAKAVLTDVVNETLPPGTPLALRVFGDTPESCETALAIPFQPLDPADATARIGALQAINLVKTPIGAALEQVANDLADAAEPRIVVLVTDGEETCGGDPATAIQSLVTRGIEVRVNIVGFALDDAALAAQFEEWARLGNGAYFEATGADDLGVAIARSVQPPFRVVAADGTVVARGVVGGELVEVPAGTYAVEILSEPAQTIEGVAVGGGEAVELTLEMTS